MTVSPRWLWLGVAAVGVFGLGVWMRTDSERRPERAQEPDKATERTAAPQETSESSRPAVHLANARIRALENRLAELETDLEDGDAERRGSKAAERRGREQPRSKTERIASADVAFSNESFDQEWSTVTEQRIETALAKGAFEGTTKNSLACRSTFCRLEVSHESEDARSKFERVSSLVRMGAVGIPTEGADGELKTTVYFIRKGHDTPEHPARL